MMPVDSLPVAVHALHLLVYPVRGETLVGYRERTTRNEQETPWAEAHSYR